MGRISRTRAVFIGLALALAALATLFGIAHLPPVRSFVLDRLTAALAEYGIDARASALDYNLLTLDFRIRRLQLAAHGRDDAPFLTADELDVDLPWSAITGSLAFDSVALRHPSVRIVRSADGHTNLPTVSSGGEAGGPAAISVGSLAITDLSATIIDEANQAHVNAADLSLTLSGAPNALTGRLTLASPASITWNQHHTSITRLDGRLGFDGSTVALRNFQIVLPEATARIEGRVTSLLNTPQLALSVKSEADLGRLAAWTSIEPRPAGRIDVNAQVDGPAADPHITVRVNGPAVRWAGFQSIALSAAADVTTARAELRELQARIAGGTITGRGQIAYSAADQAGNAHLTWRDVDLTELLRGLPTAIDAGVQSSLGGQLDARWARLAPDAVTLTIANTASASNIVTGLAGTLDGRLDGGRWSASLDERLGAGLSMSGTVDGELADRSVSRGLKPPPPVAGELADRSVSRGLKPPRDTFGEALRRSSLAGQLTLVSEDLPAAARSLVSVTGTNARPPSMAGRVRADVSLAGTIAQPRFRANLGAQDLRINDSQPATVTASASGSPTAIAISSLDATLGSNTLHGSGAANLRTKAVSGQIDATLADLASFASALPPRVQPAGALHVAGTIGGRWTNPRVEATLSGDQLRLAGQPLDTLTARLSVDHHQLAAHAELPDVSASADATLALEPLGDFTLNARLAPPDLSPILARLPKPPPVPIAGSLIVDLSARGNLRRPSTIAATLGLGQISGSLAGVPVQLQAPAEITYAHRTIEAQPIDVQVGGAQIHVSGTLGQPASDAITAKIQGDLSDLQPFVRLADTRATGIDHQVTLAGNLSVDATASGALAHPAVSGHLTIANGRVATARVAPVDGLTLDAAYEAGMLTLSKLAATWQQARLNASGRLPARLFSKALPPAYLASLPAGASGPARLDATFSNLTPQMLTPYVSASTLSQIGGQIAGTLTLEADRPEIARARGELTLTRADLTLAGIPIGQREPTRLVLADGRLRVASFAWNDGTPALRNSLSLGGEVDLAGDHALDLDVQGNLDLRMLGAFDRDITTAGRAQVDVHAGGTIAAPALSGGVQLADAELRYPNAELVVSGVSGAVQLTPTGVTIPGLTGEVNGGTLRVSGGLDYVGSQAGEGAIAIDVGGAALNLAGLRTQIDAALKAGLHEEALAVTGSVHVLRGAYRAPFTLTGGLMAALQQQAISISTGPPSMLDATALDVDVTTAQDIEIDNNYAQLEVGLDLSVVGTAAQPGLTGRATVREGGEIFLGGNTYRIQGPGSIDFVNPSAIEPDLDITAVTHVAGIDVALALSGTPQRFSADLTSPGNSSMSQAQLASLLLTGRPVEEGNTAQLAVGTSQLLGYLSGEFLGTAGRALGLSTLRIESGLPNVSFDPSLVSADTNPSTRLTFGKDVTRSLRLIFSQSLTDSGGLAWIVSYTPRATVDLRATYLENGTRRYGFMQELTSSGSPLAQIRGTRTPPAKVAAIELTGEPGFPRETLVSKLKLTAGDNFSFFRWQNDRDRLLDFYHAHGYAEARVRTSRSETSPITLTYDLHRGPETILTISGGSISGRVRGQMEAAWERSVFDGFLLDELRSIARTDLASRGYLRAKVDASVARDTPEAKEIAVRIDAGPRTDQRSIVFSGNRRLSADELRQVVHDQDLDLRAWTDLQALVDAIATSYRNAGNAAAQVNVGKPRFVGDRAELPVTIDEGPIFRVRSVRLLGLLAKSATDVSAALNLPPGTIYSPVVVQRAIGRVDALYRQSGFNAEHTSLQIDLQRESGAVDLTVIVDEGARQVLADVVMEGARRTDPDVVKRALEFKSGNPVVRSDWALARKRLYDTGAFESVDIEAEPLQIGPAAPGEDGVPTEPVRARVTLEEWPALRVRYGFQVQDEPDDSGGRRLRPGLAGDLTFRNLFGHAMSLGIAGQLTRNYRAARTNLTAPTMFGAPILTNLYFERVHDVIAPSAENPTLTDESTITAEQRVTLAPHVQLFYSYSFGRNHTHLEHIDPTDPFAFDLTVNIARLTTTALYDTRNDLVNATRGLFTSATFEYSPPALGSELRFVRSLLQQQYFRSLGAGVVFATDARLGLANAFGQDLIPSERFFTGGGNSVRGYEEDTLGPSDFLGPTGGNALLVLNEELRFPIFKIVRGVGFFDAGNVFPRIGDLSLLGLETSTGFGLRLNTPFGLLRVDYGIPLTRTTGLSFGRWFFSIGQAF